MQYHENQTFLFLFEYIYNLDQPGHSPDNILSRPLLSSDNLDTLEF